MKNESTSQNPIIYLKDYKPSGYKVESIELAFDLHEEECIVVNRMQIIRTGGPKEKLVLKGEEQKLLEIELNGQILAKKDYTLTEKELILHESFERGELVIETSIRPQDNKALEGLYKSGNMYCTQNEPEGFRRITYFLDRPDIMTKYRTRISADKKKYPVLLSNGNKVDEGELDQGRHFVVWEDPFAKPSYLFALVAGDLHCHQDYYTSMSGRKISLQIFVEKHNADKCEHAAESLKKSMKWDEDTYGLEYDLDIYMIVAADAFNMGAMENKGLNIFNSACVLANAQTATDFDYERIEAIVGHEYFHNWTGNRVTCRDWFQLTLKEGLTVFRDQNFTADQTSHGVKRINDVWALRQGQFPEDAGPNAHPIRPESYIEINNFYTATVYNKGAEIIRMVETFIGKDDFRKGIDKYFELFDGQAVTTEDFLYAMELASGFEFSQFKRWYSQAGTPIVKVEEFYDAEKKEYKVVIHQSCAPTPGQEEKLPFHFPLRFGLLTVKGRPIELQHFPKGVLHKDIFNIQKETEEFTFTGIEEWPILSINRHFSAPVKLAHHLSSKALRTLIKYDQDLFNRWEAAQKFYQNIIIDLWEKHREGRALELDAELSDIFRMFIRLGIEDKNADLRFIAMILRFPAESFLNDLLNVCDFEGIHLVRDYLIKEIGRSLFADWSALYHRLHVEGEYQRDALSIGQRELKQIALSYLLASEKEEALGLAGKQFFSANNMTDEFMVLQQVCSQVPKSLDAEKGLRERVLESFFNKWKHDPLIVDKWIVAQAVSSIDMDLKRITDIENLDVFDIKNPNKVRSLVRTFFSMNLVQFNARDGSGYQWVANKIIELDKFNPQMAASMALAFNRIAKLDGDLQEKMVEELRRILRVDKLSPNTYEIVSKTLKQVEDNIMLPHRRSLNPLVYPKFQLLLIGINLILLLIFVVALYFVIGKAFQEMVSVGEAAQIPPEHIYYQFLDLQQQKIWHYVLIAASFIFFFGGLMTLFVSHRIVGPMIRLKRFFLDIEQKGSFYPLKFRKYDFFSDIPEIINRALRGLRRK